MDAFLPVELFFSHVYVVDLSPSLCAVAQERFKRLGWKNVSVVCQDARAFRLPNQSVSKNGSEKIPWAPKSYPVAGEIKSGGADLITLSYSLSMIPGSLDCNPYEACTDRPSRLLQRD